MSTIDLRKFVDIDIQQHVDAVVVGTRETTALFTDCGVKGQSNVYSNYSSLNEAFKNVEGSQTLLQYAEVYFEHGGNKLKIFEGYATLTKEDIITLDDKLICVASTFSTYDELKNIAISLSSDANVYGIKEKILFSATNSVDDDLVKNFAVKYSTVIGAEMTMAAYLSKIDTHGIDTVYDYAFTQELIPAANITDDLFDSLMENNMNVDIYLANATRVCGGNCKDGIELTNNFVRIVLHQTLTDVLVQVLSQKLKSNTGLGKIYSAMTQELSFYLSCGYLTTDKVWSENTLTITRNNQQFTVIEKGTALVNGFSVKVLPLSSLTEQEQQEHKAPLIYIILADQYAIRKITISGEVI